MWPMLTCLKFFLCLFTPLPTVGGEFIEWPFYTCDAWSVYSCLHTSLPTCSGWVCMCNVWTEMTFIFLLACWHYFPTSAGEFELPWIAVLKFFPPYSIVKQHQEVSVIGVLLWAYTCNLFQYLFICSMFFFNLASKLLQICLVIVWIHVFLYLLTQIRRWLGCV